MGVGSCYYDDMDSKNTKRVVPVGVIAALLMGLVLLVEGALMSGILENRSAGLIQLVPGFAAWVDKEGGVKAAVQVPASVSPSVEPQIESVEPKAMERPNVEPEAPVEVDSSIPVG